MQHPVVTSPAALPAVPSGLPATRGAGAMRACACACAGAVLFAASVASAQVLRNGNEYGGKNHQPTQAEVSGRERAAGVALPPGQAREDARSVEQLGRQLLGAEPPSAPAAGPSRR